MIREKKMKISFGLVLAVFFILIPGLFSADTFVAFEQRLLDELFQNYNPNLVPITDDKKPVVVTFGLNINQISELDEREERLSSQGWIVMHWHDYRLRWDPKQYGGIKTLRIPHEKLWKPDIMLYNSASNNHLEIIAKTQMVLYNNGTVIWVPPATIHASCKINYDHYPHDVQKCYFKFGSWTQSGDIIDLTNTGIDLSYYMENNEWELIKTSYERNSQLYQCCPEAYIDVTYNLVLQRRSTYFLYTTGIPLIVSVLLTLSTFVVPPKSSSTKLWFGFGGFLIQFSVLSILSHELHPSEHEIPDILWFCGCSTLTSGVILLYSAFLICWSQKDLHYRAPPRWLLTLAKSRLSCLLGMGPYASLPDQGVELDSEENRANENSNGGGKFRHYHCDWLKCLTLIDRVVFLVFFFVFLGLALSLLH